MMFPHTAKHIQNMLNTIKTVTFLKNTSFIDVKTIYTSTYIGPYVESLYTWSKSKTKHVLFTYFTKNMQMEFVEHFYANLT